ncbi:hypothetical protein EN820_54790 [bacterium M00.F.Ca.ET.177.01.1.1]|nr:hypothetical protein EN820_54790 [bacterium M00.F.Ca.ET.177.01.1.1]
MSDSALTYHSLPGEAAILAPDSIRVPAYIGLLIILYVAVNMLLGGAVQQFPDHFAFLAPWFGSDGH